MYISDKQALFKYDFEQIEFYEKLISGLEELANI